jgi:hypothetical protein
MGIQKQWSECRPRGQHDPSALKKVRGDDPDFNKNRNTGPAPLRD